MRIHLLRLGFLAAIFTTIHGEEISLESSIRTVYSNYKQCENDPQMIVCLKLKALKLIDRALAINNIPIIDGVSLTKKEDGQRSLDESPVPTIDENGLPEDSQERDKKLDFLLWDRIKQFVETRSLQLKVNKLFYGDNTDLEVGEDGRGKKDKNKGMYVYLMMMKGGMMALAYKGLALLAGKALLVSKIALTLALLVAIKKLFSGGHHSQKTTYEIVKTPIITHSHQYAGGNSQSGHYGAADFSSYEGGPYARSLDFPEEISKRVGQKAEAPNPKYVTHIIETVEGRSISELGKKAQGRSLSTESSPTITEANLQHLNIPYAHLAAYRHQLKSNLPEASSTVKSESRRR